MATEVGQQLERPPRKGRANVGPGSFVRYRGGPGMAAWLLHRLAGLGLLFFLFWHVVDTALIGWGPGAYDASIALYRRTVFRVGEILLFGALLYHALNGIRIVVIDFWSRSALFHKTLWAAVVFAFIVLYVPIIVVMVQAMRGQVTAP
jgi:succinate dehydrogenase / fumarate reductase cytochrome b subunit